MGQGIEQTGGASGHGKKFWKRLRDRCEDWVDLLALNLRDVIKILRNSPTTYMVTGDEETLASWDERESEEGAGQRQTYPMVLRFRMSRDDIMRDDEGRVICLTRMTLDYAVRALMRVAFEDGMVLELWEERG